MKANHTFFDKLSTPRAIVGFAVYTLATVVYAAQPGMTREGAVTVMTFPDAQTQLASDPIDYVNAQSLPLPVATNFSKASC